MTAAETLREAAALMRKRAEAAAPGPWVAWGHHVCCVVNQCNCGCGGMAGLPHEPLCGLEDLGEVADPEHIASWHPLVALAVADSIDAFLASHWAKDSSAWSSKHRAGEHVEGDPRCTAECLDEFQICNGCGTSECGDASVWLPIATAYLGGAS